MKEQESAPKERIAAAMLASVLYERGRLPGAALVKVMEGISEPALQVERHGAGTFGLGL